MEIYCVYLDIDFILFFTTLVGELSKKKKKKTNPFYDIMDLLDRDLGHWQETLVYLGKRLVQI